MRVILAVSATAPVLSGVPQLFSKRQRPYLEIMHEMRMTRLPARPAAPSHMCPSCPNSMAIVRRVAQDDSRNQLLLRRITSMIAAQTYDTKPLDVT
jgi:hypothetical protein